MCLEIRISNRVSCLVLWKLGSVRFVLVLMIMVRARPGRLRFPVSTRALMTMVVLLVLRCLKSVLKVDPACAAL